MKGLAREEISRRMQEWRNFKVLHKKAVQQNRKLKTEIKILKKENHQLKAENIELKKVVECLLLRIEELEQIIFGKSREKDNDSGDFSSNDNNESKLPKKRNPESYQRKKPNPAEITETKRHSIDQCPDCRTKLRRKRIVVFYEEDILLPDKNTRLKAVIEHRVEKGWCPQCKKWHTAIPLPCKKALIGDKVKFYICYLSILIRLSYPQIINLLRDTCGFSISNGKIANILAEMSVKFRPEFERLKKSLQNGKGVHLDETGWRKLYLWVMASIDTEEVLYLAGRNRGNRHIDELLGENFQGIRINDAYAAYKNKRGDCQQCLAHPHRKLKDLAESKTLSPATRKHCQTVYQEFSEIYGKVRACIAEPFDPIRRKQQKAELLKDFSAWRKFRKKDPQKLHNIRQQFHDYETEWLTCLDYEGVPCDNNKAERMLRHFVIKRKISFGTKTEKTSENFSILASVLMTYWKKFEGNFFQNLVPLAG